MGSEGKTPEQNTKQRTKNETHPGAVSLPCSMPYLLRRCLRLLRILGINHTQTTQKERHTK
jgi:hypothetical protein